MADDIDDDIIPALLGPVHKLAPKEGKNGHVIWPDPLPDYYGMLNVARSAKDQEILEAFANIEGKFFHGRQDIMEMRLDKLREDSSLAHVAYRVLINPRLRSLYEAELIKQEMNPPTGLAADMESMARRLMQVRVPRRWSAMDENQREKIISGVVFAAALTFVGGSVIGPRIGLWHDATVTENLDDFPLLRDFCRSLKQQNGQFTLNVNMNSQPVPSDNIYIKTTQMGDFSGDPDEQAVLLAAVNALFVKYGIYNVTVQYAPDQASTNLYILPSSFPAVLEDGKDVSAKEDFEVGIFKSTADSVSRMAIYLNMYSAQKDSMREKIALAAGGADTKALQYVYDLVERGFQQATVGSRYRDPDPDGVYDGYSYRFNDMLNKAFNAALQQSTSQIGFQRG